MVVNIVKLLHRVVQPPF